MGAMWRNKYFRCNPTLREDVFQRRPIFRIRFFLGDTGSVRLRDPPGCNTCYSPPELVLENNATRGCPRPDPQLWVSTISAAPHTEEVAQSTVDTLLQVVTNPNLRQSIPANVWLCFNRRPSLLPACRGPSW